MEIGTRMTVVRVSLDKLFVHSPTRLDEATKLQFIPLGRVKYVVSPNNMHHFFIGDYFSPYPDAKIYASPGLDEKRRDLKFQYFLKDYPEPEWQEEIDQAIVWGHPQFKEVVFFHKKSRTLILADLLMNFDENIPIVTKVTAKMMGIYKKVSPPLDFTKDVIDLPQARLSIEKILKWDFDKIILAHGGLIEKNGKEIFRQAFSFVFEK